MIDIAEILNGKRDYQFYEPPSPDAPDTLESVEEDARKQLFNGPGGNEMILRLIEIIKALQADAALRS
jgi:hypothetical protein